MVEDYSSRLSLQQEYIISTAKQWGKQIAWFASRTSCAKIRYDCVASARQVTPRKLVDGFRLQLAHIFARLG